MNENETLTLDRLPPEIQGAIKTKRLSGKKKLRQWLVILKILSKFDEQVDARLKKANRKKALFAVLAFLSVFATIFGTAMTDGNTMVLGGGGAAFVVFLVLFIIFLSKASSLKGINLDNSFRDTLLPLFEILSEDIPPKGKISLDLNLDDPASLAHKVSEKKLPPGRNKKLIERVFRSRPVQAVIPLANGTQLTMEIVKQPASYDRYYRNPRGKYKHKKKWKMLTLVTAGLVPMDGEFAVDIAQVDQMADREKIKLKQKHGGQLCQLTRKIKSKSATGVPEEPVPPELMVDMFMQLCTMLNPAG